MVLTVLGDQINTEQRTGKAAPQDHMRDNERVV